MAKKKITKSNELLAEMKITGLDPDEWVLAREASNKVKCYSYKQIQKLGEKGVERVGTEIIGNTKLYNLKDILQYAANNHKKPTLNPVWNELTFLPGEHFYPLVGYDLRYFVSNKQRFIDATNCQLLTPQLHFDNKGRMTGYLTVTLMKDGKPKNEKLHRLVGKTQCPNAFNHDVFHHINNTKRSGLYDNRASNILPIANGVVHNKLHKLMKEDKKAYKEMIAKLKKENKQNNLIFKNLPREKPENPDS